MNAVEEDTVETGAPTKLLGLKRILVHNAHVASKSFIIEVDGPTNIQGENGSGKSSILALTSIFYGAEPRHFMEKASEKKPFAEYYLPGKYSFLAFEYERQDGRATVLMYRAGEAESTSNRVTYRFLKGSIAETLEAADIIDMRINSLNAEDIVKAMRKNGVSTSRAFDTLKDYRAVLENHKSQRVRLGTEQRLYSLLPTGKEASNLGQVCATLLKRSNPFERLHQMIADTAFGDRTTRIAQGVSSCQIHESKSQITALLAVGDIKSLIADAYSDNVEMRSKLSEIRTLGEKSNHYLTVFAAEDASFQIQLSETISLIDSTRKAYNEKHEELQRELSKTTINLKDAEDWLNNYHNKLENSFAGIEEKKTAYANLGEDKRALESLMADLNLLRSEVEGLTSEKERLVAQAKDDFSNQKARIERRIDILKEEVQKYRDEKTEAVDAAKLTTDNELEALANSPTIQAIDNLRHELSVAKHAASRTTILDEDQNKLDSLQRSIDDIRRVHTTLSKEERDLLANKGNLLNNINALQNEILKLERQKSAVKAEIDALIGLENSNSLLSRLNKSDDANWKTTIGKAIDPTLLAKTNLQPEFDPSANSETIFGWSIDLSKVVTHADVIGADDLSLKRSQLEERLLDIDGQIKEALSQKKILIDSEAKLDSELRVIKNKIASLSGEENSLSLNLQRSRAEAEDRARKAAAQAKAQIDELLTLISKHEKDLSDAKLDIKERGAANLRELRAEYSLKEQSKQEEIDLVKEQIKDAQLALDKRLNIYEMRFDEDCIKHGVAPKIIQTKSDEVKNKRDYITKVEGFIGILNAYDEFAKTQTPRYPEYRDSANTLSKKKQSLNKDIENTTQEGKREVRKLEEQKESISRNKTNNAKMKRDLSDLIGKAERATDKGIVGSLEPSESEHYDLVATSLEQRTNDYLLYKKKLEKCIPKVISAMNGLPDSEWRNEWLEIKSGVDCDTELSLEFLDAVIDPLNRCVVEYFDIRQTAIRSDLDLTFSAIDRVFDNLKLLNSDVDSKGRAIGRAVNTNQRIANLSDVKIRITSKAKSSVCWVLLERLIADWNSWGTTDGVDSISLPKPKLVTQMLDAYTALENEPFYGTTELSMRELIDIELSMTENGTPRTIRNTKDFNAVSSNGLSLLAIIVVFKGISRYICPAPEVTITWSIDEIGTLDMKNVVRMLQMLKEANISILSALPFSNRQLLSLMNNCYMAQKDKGIASVNLHKRKGATA